MTKLKENNPATNEIVSVENQTRDNKIVPVNNELSNFDPEKQVEFAQKAAKALMVVIDATKPLMLQGKRYLYFEHWQTVARFFNTTVGIAETIKDTNGYIAKAVVYNKDGVVIGGAEASCMNDERNWKGKPDFQLRSMAQTRAMAKALRSIYGFVAVLAGVETTPAEEMQDVHVDSVQPNKVSTSGYATEKQIKYIKDLMEQRQITKEQMGAKFPTLTGQNLTFDQASQVITWLKHAVTTTEDGVRKELLDNSVDNSKQEVTLDINGQPIKTDFVAKMKELKNYEPRTNR